MSTIGKALAVIGTLVLAEFGLVGPVAGQTKVAIDGTDITITVPIDGVGIDKKTAAEWKHGAESLWNAAFNAADNPFKGCLTLKLVVDVQAHDFSYPAQPGRHMIFQTHGTTSNQASGTIAANGDPFKTSADGNFDESFGNPDKAKNEDPYAPDDSTKKTDKSNYVAHEVGHLIGLGDEYTVTGSNPRTTKPLPGRENTLMADGGRIDAALLKQLLKRLKDETHQMPDCLKGTLHANAVYSVPKNGPAGAWWKCTDAWAVDMTVIAAADGALSGQAISRRDAPPKCEWPATATWTQVVNFQIAGSRDAAALHLRFVYKSDEPAGGVDMTGFNALLAGFGNPKVIDLPIVGNKQARGPVTFDWADPSNKRNVAGDLSLECTTCEMPRECLTC